MQSHTEENRRVVRPLRTRQLNLFDSDEQDQRQQPLEQQPQQMVDQQRQISEDLVSWRDLNCQLSTNNLDNIQLEIRGGSSSTNQELLALSLEEAQIDFCAGNESFPYQQLMEGANGWEALCCNVPQQRESAFLTMTTAAPTIAPVTTQAPTIRYDPTSPDQVDFFPFVVGQCFVSSFAAFFSLAMILAMTLPLLKKRRRKRASTYNLYLVFLAIPDLIYNLFLVYVFGTYNRVMQETDEFGNIRNFKWVAVLHVGEVPWIDHPFDLALFATCAAANLYMNAIIALEILKLLRNSKRRKRSKAPTLQKACLQAACTYTIGVIIFVTDYFNDDLKERLPTWLVTLIFLPIAILIPIFILLWVCFRIYWEGLIGDTRTTAGKRLTILIRYFTRIIVIYICIWLPAAIFYTFQFYDEMKEGLYYYIACTLYAMSAWANFGLSLTKPDVRKNFRDLFTGRVCMPEPKAKKDEKKFSNSGVSEDKPAKVTTNTDEEDLGDKFPIEQGTGADPELGPIEINDNGDIKKKECSSASQESADCNVFDFAGADAPVRRLPTQKSAWAMVMPTVAMPQFSAPRRTTTISADATPSRRSSFFGARSRRFSASKMESSEWARDANSEPFQIHSTTFQEDSRRGSFFGRRNSSGGASRTSTGNSSIDPLAPTNKSTPPVLEEQDEESQSNSAHDDIYATTTAGASALRSSERSTTTAFFMDKSCSTQSIVSASPRVHKKWTVGLKKNIRDMVRIMKSPGVSEDRKSVYQQSIQLNRRALQSIALPYETERSSVASINVDGVDVSSMTEMSMQDNSDSDSDVEDSEVFGSDHKGVVHETRYSKVQWVSELNDNINDLNARLEQEDLAEEERALISRAIESQKVTLASIECIGEDADGSVLPISPKNGDNARNSTFVTSALDVIVDESESSAV